MSLHPCTFWAKLDRASWPDEYHPVICHLIDVGQVARHPAIGLQDQGHGWPDRRLRRRPIASLYSAQTGVFSCAEGTALDFTPLI